MQPNAAGICPECLKNEVDITEGIPKTSAIQWCKGCGRYLQPPAMWITAELESPQLMSLCLKRLKGLGKVKLLDASFVWTEPHSKRLKVNLTVQKEVYEGTVLQQSFVVEFIVENFFCPECHRTEAKNTWQSVVQIRQKVSHKRTFFFLEQLILKYDMHQHTSNIKEFAEGLDFYFLNKVHAMKMVDFLHSVVPCRHKLSKRLVSQDLSSNMDSYKHSFSVEIAPVCRDDLVCLPKKLARSLGGVYPIGVAVKVTNAIYVIDPNTMRGTEIRTDVYFSNPFRSLWTSERLTEFMVVDSELTGATLGKYAQADVSVMKTSDMERTYQVRSHLGHLLQPGDLVLGYELETGVFNSAELDEYPNLDLPDVVLVRKTYPSRRKARRRRAWKLQRANIEEAVDDTKGISHKRRERDMEEFMRDLEDDPELRAQVNLYKDPQFRAGAGASSEGGMDTDEEEEDYPEVAVNELLDDLTI